MNLKRNPLFVIGLAACLVIGIAGCKKQAATTVPETPVPAEKPAPPPPPPPVEVVEPEKFPEIREPFEEEKVSVKDIIRQLQTVYFEFDKYDLGDETRSKLLGNFNVLKSYSQYGVVVEGHCDERGTIEYNLALGEKRARAVRDYLISLGIKSSRLRIKSFGEERPAVSRHKESAWAKNRRAEFNVEE